jgi:glucosamine--fructose-6-phosphate aminotransferase (isomerizing)
MSAMPDRVSFRDAINLQPRALAAAFAATSSALAAIDLEPLRGGTIGIVGIGASLYAAAAGAAQLRRQRRRALALVGGDLYDAGIDAADAYIAISASGRSVEPAKALALRPDAATYGIAQSRDTPLAGSVRQMIGTGSGIDSGPNTTSYIGSLQAIGLIADAVGVPNGFGWAGLSDELARTLAGVGAAVGRAADLLDKAQAIDCVGADVAHGTAGYAALLLREAVRVHAQHWDTLNFLHGPMEPNDGGSGVIVFGDGREVKLAQDLAGFGIPTVLVTSRPIAETPNLVTVGTSSSGNGLADAILQAAPAQLLVAELAERAGLAPCVFRYRQTDTKLASVTEG